ncbi:MAG: 50S ribosomal protein L1 [Candidatus Dojkabacteria bacterium]|nr:MAG: 50S ribosomal protein L1 [Candidatus Dojkabacteria bacterium]
MATRSKQYQKMKKAAPAPDQEFALKDAVAAVKKLSYSKFDGTVELHITLKLPKDTDMKSLKGSVSLPHSTGTKDVKVAVFCTPDNEAAAKEAGADMYNMEQLIKDVKGGKVDFDVAIATPDVMPQIAMLGKELGPRGLMPNPKTGTVTDDVATAVSEYKKGKLTFKCDDSGNMHFPVGKISMEDEQIVENIMAAVAAASDVVGRRPAQLVSKAHLAPTMGASVKVRFEFED